MFAGRFCHNKKQVTRKLVVHMSETINGCVKNPFELSINEKNKVK